MKENDKDKEAFEKWWRENMPNPDWLSSDHSTDVCKAWEAACEFKQREIDELLAENAKLKEEIKNVWKEAEKYYLDD